MNLEEAVAFHATFRVRLRAFITAPEASVPASISRDDLCPLGQWLHSPEGMKFAAHQEYRNLLACHKDLHQAATHAATKAIGGEPEAALEMLTNGEFAARSKSIIQAITGLKRVVNK